MSKQLYILQFAAKENARVFSNHSVYDNALDASAQAEQVKRCFPKGLVRVEALPYYVASNVSQVQAQAAE